MYKGIEWLKEEIEEDIKSWGGGNPDYFRGASDAYENVKDWLNQLDEPEVLSREWIDDKTWNNHYIGRPFVYVDDLQEVILPKQEETSFKAGDKVWVDLPVYFERDTVYTVASVDYQVIRFEESRFVAHRDRVSKAVTEEPTETPTETNRNTPVKPVIPDYVAKALEEASYLDKWKIPSYLQSQSNYRADQRLHTWLEENMDVVMQALVNGYEVDETRFYALIKGHEKVEDGYKYWAFNVDGSLTVEVLDPTIGMTATLGKWEELGIADDNAVFIEEGKL